jgi:hypothetical protein
MELHSQPLITMGKHIPFGPGHPDYDNQLDLFEQLEPELADQNQADLLQKAPACKGKLFPCDITCKIPCPVCVGEGPDEAVLQMAVTSPARYRDLLPGGDGDVACLLCQGKAEMAARLRRADGFWWDWELLRVIKAETLDQARRKAKGSEPTPLYVEHGGYSSTSWAEA